MHTCKDCGETDITKFSIRSTNKKPYNYCRPCRNKRSLETRRKYLKNNKDKKAKWDKKYYEENKEKISEYRKAYQIEKSGELSARKRDYYLSNKEKVLEAAAEYKRKNSERVNHWCAMRRANKLNATPNWLSEFDLFVIEEMYDLAKIRSKETGIKWHVDHIIPLNHKKVQGLHVPWNLQVIPAEENLRKGNKLKI